MSKKDVPIFILCGGLGTRLSEETGLRPKPMVEIGGKPILWHVMRSYASHGFRRFVLCSGYKSEVIKDYFLNYHARLPAISLNAADASCSRNGDPGDIISAFDACNGFRSNTQDGLEPLPIETMDLFLEYPEDIQMFGVSFNTPAGPDYSLQGEVAYRPNLPLQLSVADLAFAAFGPSLTACHREELGCNGSTAGVDFDADGNRVIVGDSDFVDADGNNPYPDTINLIVGSAPGSARSFPNFIIPYRGGVVGENPANSYIRGWEPFDVVQYNLGATRIYGQSEAILGADQIIMIYELGATHVLGFPDFDELQIEGPLSGTTHASAGADGSGADGSRQACSTNPTCTVGPDGLRFNPYQASRDQFAHAFSWGYRIVSIIRYDSVLPGISIEPTLIWGHDINGNAPGPGGNFVEGRKTLNSTVQFRYKTAFSFNVSYQLFTGGGANHLLRDRDNLGFFFRYQF